MARLVDIADGTEDTLEVDFADIIERLHESAQHLNWSLLYLDAMGDLGQGRSMSEFEQEIREAPYGIAMTWDEVIALSRKLWHVYQIVLAGYEGEPRVTHLDRLPARCCKSKMVVELSDSTLWTVYSEDESLITKLARAFNDVKIQDHLLEGGFSEAADR